MVTSLLLLLFPQGALCTFHVRSWRRRGVGDEGSDFLLTWTHQSGKKQSVDRRVKAVLLGQLGNFRDQFRRLHKVSPKRRRNRLTGNRKPERFAPCPELPASCKLQVPFHSRRITPHISLGIVPTANVRSVVVRRPSWDGSFVTHGDTCHKLIVLPSIRGPNHLHSRWRPSRMTGGHALSLCPTQSARGGRKRGNSYRGAPYTGLDLLWIDLWMKS
ncbi:uncharacterized protein LOC123978294 isoform X2 [Micropterus dolomieu]|uniref:uncharacterized protein LOC123978294 isoform X2 n=1 Tax=Micropterus dolomieu TaxID=147949 RepID=UPI001E8DED5D|nr:uncharacterized protein LOC123978294 isoform X2 [Micropterus dolomieu]